MKDKGRKLLDGALERLRVALEGGHSEQLTAYLRAMRRFRRYSVGNVLLIALQRADATHVAGFHTWRRMGRCVRKGERGIPIVAPVLRREKAHDDDADDERERVLSYRAVCVFDVSQTDGDPLPEPAQVAGDPASALPRLHAFAAARGIQVQYADDRLGGAMGASLGGRIILRSGMSPAEEFSTLAHELAHERLHKGDNADSRRIRELEAEAVAFAVCDTVVGFENSLAAARDYVQRFGASSDDLLASLERIQSTAMEIITWLEQDPSEDSMAASATRATATG